MSAPLLRLCLIAVGALWLGASDAAPPEPIRVVLDDNYPPYTFRDEHGIPQGLLKDLWALWSQRTGVAVDYRPMEWGKARAALENGQADVIDTIFRTPEREKIYAFSPPYAAIEVALFFDQQISGIVDVNSARGFTIGVKEGDACIEFLTSRGLADLKAFPSYEAEVKAAALREIRVFCIDAPPATYFLNRIGAAERFRHTSPLFVGEFHRAVTKENAELLRFVEAGFAKITPEERKALEARWFGQPVGASVWERYRQPILYGIGALAALTTLLLGWSAMLRRQVAQRTAVLTDAMASLHRSEERIQGLLDEQRLIFDNAHVGILELQNRRILKCNQRIADMFGFESPDELVGRSTELFYCSPEEFEAAGRKGYAQLAEHGSADFETEMCRQNGERIWVIQSGRPLDPNRVLEAPSIWVYTDITERRRAEAKIESLAFYDQLTGLANRVNLNEQLAQAVRLCTRNAQSFALMLLDLDNFKAVNDSLGHHVGDQLLEQIARRLVAAVRQSDFVARLGGDEFVVLLPALDSPADAAHVADKILHALAAPCRLGQHELRVSASIGICLFPDDATDAHDLLQKADAAMYHAKARGRGNYQFFEEKIQQAAVERLALESALRKAIANREFLLHYQPQLELKSGRICGVEALLRWRHPERGLVAPGEFLPLAEENGLIEEIGDWALVEAARQLAAWRAAGLAELTMSVNLSAVQFANPALPVRIDAIVAEAGLPPHALQIEITESMTMRAPDEAVSMMRVLAGGGVSIAIDDFGTGYSSLAYLKLFPIDTLKIDRSFVKDIETDPHDADICDVTVLLAHRLGLDVVAEGVETEAQLTYLLSIGCEKIQGYLIGKPLPADEAEAFIRHWPGLERLGTVELWTQ